MERKNTEDIYVESEVHLHRAVLRQQYSRTSEASLIQPVWGMRLVIQVNHKQHPERNRFCSKTGSWGTSKQIQDITTLFWKSIITRQCRFNTSDLCPESDSALSHSFHPGVCLLAQCPSPAPCQPYTCSTPKRSGTVCASIHPSYMVQQGCCHLYPRRVLRAGSA